MTQDNKINRPPLSAWQTELVRLTAFPTPEMNIVDQNWWELAVGEKPVIQNKDMRVLQKTDEGEFKDGRLILGASPLRIDWVYRTQEIKPDELMTKLPILGSYEQVLSDFSEVIDRWLSTPNLSISRLAFGGVLLQEVDNHPNGYELISSYLPFTLDANNISDFIYRISRKRQSEVVNELVINPLSTWSAIALRNFSLTFSGGQVIQQDTSDPLYAARLELDINTSQDYATELPHQNLQELFQELVRLGTEIAVNGDKT